MVGQRQEHEVPPKLLSAYVPPKCKAFVEQKCKKALYGGKMSISLYVTQLIEREMEAEKEAKRRAREIKPEHETPAA